MLYSQYYSYIYQECHYKVQLKIVRIRNEDEDFGLGVRVWVRVRVILRVKWIVFFLFCSSVLEKLKVQQENGQNVDMWTISREKKIFYFSFLFTVQFCGIT